MTNLEVNVRCRTFEVRPPVKTPTNLPSLSQHGVPLMPPRTGIDVVTVVRPDSVVELTTSPRALYGPLPRFSLRERNRPLPQRKRQSALRCRNNYPQKMPKAGDQTLLMQYRVARSA